MWGQIVGPKDSLFKGETIATGAASKKGGVMIKLSGLFPCLLYSALLGIQTTAVVMFTTESS